MICLAFQAKGEILITQVHYDPDGADTGYEFVELYNTGADDVSLEGYKLESGDGSTPDDWTTEWTGTGQDVISAKGYFLIGEDLVQPVPDIITSIDLQNGPDACRISRNGTVIDLVGWGEHTIEEYYLGTPAAEPETGLALQRKSTMVDDELNYLSTDDNGADFIGAPARPKNSGFGTTSSAITITAIIAQDELKFQNMSIEDMDDGPGIQLLGMPGKNKSVAFTMILSCASGTEKIDASATFADIEVPIALAEGLSPVEGIFGGAFLLPYHLEPGKANLTVDGNCGDGPFVRYTETLEVLPLTAFEIDIDSIDFTDLRPGSVSAVIGDNDLGTEGSPTIRNFGNIGIDLIVTATDLVFGDLRINSSNLDVAIGNDESSMDKEDILFPVNLQSRMSVPLSMTMMVPQESTAGIYQGSMLISAVSSG